jgi:hypothetical protein
MGDKSPKSVHKQIVQKQLKVDAEKHKHQQQQAAQATPQKDAAAKA